MATAPETATVARSGKNAAIPIRVQAKDVAVTTATMPHDAMPTLIIIKQARNAIAQTAPDNADRVPCTFELPLDFKH